MRKYLILMAVLLTAMTAEAQESNFFEPYQTTELRLPSVPIFVNDPYFSIWSPFDVLNTGTTRHWDDAEKPIDGLLRVDGAVYRFMGKKNEMLLSNALLPMSEKAWEAPTFMGKMSDSKWTGEQYDDSQWSMMTGAFGKNVQEYPNIRTIWSGETDIYVRRHLKLTADDLKKDLYLVYSHDDECWIYINGHQVVYTGNTWVQGENLHLIDSYKRFLHEGDNIIAARCHNNMGGTYLDYGIYENSASKSYSEQQALQTGRSCMATSSYYSFKCGPVDLTLVFTAPMLIDDLDVLSTPVNYYSYRVQSNDGKTHSVQFYLGTTPQLATNDPSQATVSTLETSNGLTYVKSGTKEQPILQKSGDNICIDWGYLYLPAVNGSVSIATQNDMLNTFANRGTLPDSAKKAEAENRYRQPTLGYVHDFGSTTQASSFGMIAYDEVYDIQYMQKNYKGYWARNGKTIVEAMNDFKAHYNDYMERSKALDKRIYDDGRKSGDKKYAELLSASYRQVIAAHKLFEDSDGRLMFFSKENNSNGCVNTVDLTYPSAPLFLMYNPELEKGMMNSIFEYCRTGKWTKDFAPHDLGTYPLANGQVYGGDMPIEESGNMLTLAATICMKEKSTQWVEPYWNLLTKWTNYLVLHGQHPENQLCTDDFAGPSENNANLSLKAIMGIAGMAQMALIKGDTALYRRYSHYLPTMAATWEKEALDASKDHYTLSLKSSGTWSMKYNLVWDQLWGLNLFSDDVYNKEMDYYQTKFNSYGTPLDSRKDYTKSDWLMWVAALAADNSTFCKFADLLWKYINETPSRVPISDWYDTKTGAWVSFRARSVIGGHWMKVLMDNFVPMKQPTGIEEMRTTKGNAAIYDLNGMRLNQLRHGVNILRTEDGTVKKVLFSGSQQ